MTRPPLPDEALADVAAGIDAWLAAEGERNPLLVAAHRDPEDDRRWLVRVRGDAKEFTTVWLRLGQRMLHYETYVMPHPEEQREAFFEHLLRRNDALVGAHFSIGAEDAVFLRGALPLHALDDDELDRVLGTLLDTVERTFRPALQLGFASRFRSADE